MNLSKFTLFKLLSFTVTALILIFFWGCDDNLITPDHHEMADIQVHQQQAQSTPVELGGPVLLMGLDSEFGAGFFNHGPPEEHVAMVEALLNNVTNEGEGILVIGDGTYVRHYWEGDIGEGVGQNVTFVSGADDIRNINFNGYAIIGVASNEVELFSGGLTQEENNALVERAHDIANFVNDGGGLLGKTQYGFDNAWEYVDPFGDFMNAGEYFGEIIVEQAGLDMGLTQDGMSGWCCYHEVFLDYPDFFDVLISHNQSTEYWGEAAVIGGIQVVFPTVSIAIDGPVEAPFGIAREFDVQLTNDGDDTPDNVQVHFTLNRDGGIEDGDVSLEYYDPADDEWKELPLSDDNGSVSGTFGPGEGFPLPHSYDETTEIRVTFYAIDNFTTELEVVGVDTDNIYANTTHNVEVFEVEQCVDLIAGQHIDTGEVCVVNDGDDLHVTYTTTGGWMLYESHLAVSSDEVGTGEWSENGWTNRPGNPAPGRFAHNADHDPGSDDTFTYTIPLDEISGGVNSGDELHLGAHAVVMMGNETETAWGYGNLFRDQGNWAMYFEYTVQ